MANYPIPNRVPLPTFNPGMGGGMPSAPSAPAAMLARANPNGILDLGAGAPGEIKRGPDGQNYQRVQTTGMDGNGGRSQGWIPVNTSASSGGQGGGFGNWIGNNREALAAMSQGLLSGQTGPEQFAQGFGNFVQARADGKRKTKTMEFLAQQDPMTAQAVELGLLTGPEAFKAIYDAKNKPDVYRQRAQAAKQYGIDPNTPEGRAFVLTGDLKTGGAAPLSSVGKINADFNAGLIDQATRDALISKASQPDQMKLTTTDKKAILEADDMVAANENALNALDQAIALSDKANSGWFAGVRGALGNNLPDLAVPDFISSPESSVATADMDNAVIGQALSSLKAIFGGMPTEGERKILLDLQGSSTMPREVRKQVFERAKAMAQRRLEFNKQRADSLRGGTYYNSGGPPQQLQPAQGQNRTQSGVNWSLGE
jgi:hypothetical protein